jgi:hypothetical protein
VSSWGALSLAVFSATTMFLIALAVTAYIRRDDAAPRAADDSAVDAHDGGASPASLEGTLATQGPPDAGRSSVSRLDAGSVTRTAADASDPALSDAGDERGDRDAGSEDDPLFDVAAIAQAFLVPIDAALVACVRDARRRDPAAGDDVTFTIVLGPAGTDDALSVTRSPSPFATRCLVETAALPADAPGKRVDVVVSARGGTLSITRAEVAKAP